MSRALIEIFAVADLCQCLALRGGAALNRLVVPSPVRYSEDIDFVQVTPGPIGGILDAIRRRLDSWLGRPKRSSSAAGVTLTYRFQSEIPPVRPMRLKLEINTREHFAVLGLRGCHDAVSNPWFTGDAVVTTYQPDELLGTKLRALYQRRKGRDLFDLWHCLTQGLVDPTRIVACFAAYMEHEGRTVSRAEFERNLFEKATNAVFRDEIRPLLSRSTSYDPDAALTLVRKALISLLPGEAWRGDDPATIRRAKPTRRPRVRDN